MFVFIDWSYKDVQLQPHKLDNIGSVGSSNSRSSLIDSSKIESQCFVFTMHHPFLAVFGGEAVWLGSSTYHLRGNVVDQLMSSETSGASEAPGFSLFTWETQKNWGFERHGKTSALNRFLVKLPHFRSFTKMGYYLLLQSYIVINGFGS